MSSCGMGKRVPLSKGKPLGDAVIGGDNGSQRVDGSDIGEIYNVTLIQEATEGNPYSSNSELPFTGNPIPFADGTTDRQTPFSFSYSYPSNNFKLAEAHLVVDTSRDSSDTEGIFVDGVLSGRPPTNMVRAKASSPHLLYDIYDSNPSGNTANTYYIDWSIAHYKRLTRNTFDLLIDKLLEQTPLTTRGVLNDGFLPVVTGDDSPVYQAYLVIKGYTISKERLTCSRSPTYTFQNIYLHNDGNSVGQAALTGTVYTPVTSWAASPTSSSSTEFFFDAVLPKVDDSNVRLTLASISMAVKRSTSINTAAAIVINGVGVAQSGFDKSTATAIVETWDSSATTYWNSWVNSIATTGVSTNVNLDLVALLGESKVRSLISQGKLNVSIAGSLKAVYGQAATSTRGFGTAVQGPELNLQGTYATDLCEVPSNPDSPLNDSDPVPSNIGDNRSPAVSSMQASEVTSSSAVVQWLTDEPATSQVGYGIGNTNTRTTDDVNLSSFHRVQLTGLSPYKVYTFRVISRDGNGNETTSSSKTFQTLR